VQLRLPWERAPRERPARLQHVVVQGEAMALEIVRHRRARRYILRMAEDGMLRLTVPRGASIAGGLRFAERQGDWIARERVRQDARARARQPAVEAQMRVRAEKELPGRCLDLADRCGVSIARVSVRNQRSRWGSCSPKGTIMLNWRLLQMPAHVSDYVIFHELMHTKHPNHSRRFWRAVESVCPGWRDAEHWLRRHGREIL
jgi:predicted metal-dependent hydrolase